MARFFNKYGDKVFTTKRIRKKLSLKYYDIKEVFCFWRSLPKFLKNFKGESVNLLTIIDFFLLDYTNKIDKLKYGLKTPNNEVFWLDILKNYPKEFFLHLIRDPRNSEASRIMKSKLSHDEPLFHIKVWHQSFILAQEYQQKYLDSYKDSLWKISQWHWRCNAQRLFFFFGLPFEKKIMKFEGLEY